MKFHGSLVDARPGLDKMDHTGQLNIKFGGQKTSAISKDKSLHHDRHRKKLKYVAMQWNLLQTQVLKHRKSGPSTQTVVLIESQ